MSRPRTGTLFTRNGVYYVRITVDDAAGIRRRAIFCLNTGELHVAELRRKKLVADLLATKIVVPGVSLISSAQKPVREYAKAWLDARLDRGVSMAKTEAAIFKRHIDGLIGHLALGDVRPVHVRGLLDAAVKKIGGRGKRLKQGTIVQIRAVVHRIFDQAWRDEIIETNPVSKVRSPDLRETPKERVILTDDEFLRYLASPEADFELRLISLVARIQGGMRTGDLNQWAWTMIDTHDFAWCSIPRSKTKTPQQLAIPEMLRPIFRAWWSTRGRPLDGPVFPRRRGPKVGGFRKAKGHSYAASLRRDLLRANVKRHDCLRPIDGRPVTLSEACCENMKYDPLFSETVTTRPVDFHSFRRSFSTALAEANVNPQRAMMLTGHTNPNVHARYVMRTHAMKQIPVEALPKVSAIVLPPGTRTRENNEIWGRSLKDQPADEAIDTTAAEAETPVFSLAGAESVDPLDPRGSDTSLGVLPRDGKTIEELAPLAKCVRFMADQWDAYELASFDEDTGS